MPVPSVTYDDFENLHCMIAPSRFEAGYQLVRVNVLSLIGLVSYSVSAEMQQWALRGNVSSIRTVPRSMAAIAVGLRAAMSADPYEDLPQTADRLLLRVHLVREVNTISI